MRVSSAITSKQGHKIERYKEIQEQAVEAQ
jgi:hypothetical protein